MFRGLSLAAALGAAILSVSAAIAGPQPQASDAQGARMTAAFEAWAKKFKIPNASFVVMRGDKVMGTVSVGGHDARAPRPLSYLSMPVTAVCVARLVEAKRLKYDDTIGVLLKPFFDARPGLERFKDRTVRDLVLHNDVAFNSPLGIDGIDDFNALDFTQPNLEAVFAIGFRLRSRVHPSAEPVERTFRYNFANYAGLGLVIEAVTSKPYKEACTELVLAPAGVTTARMDPDWEIMSSWGGWNMSAVDYARFLDHFRPKAGLLKAPASKWPQKKFATCCVEPYGIFSLGMFLEPFVTGKYDINQYGSWKFRSDDIPERNEVYGAFFKMYRQNLRYVVTFSPSIPDRACSTLILNLDKAAFPVSTIAEAPSDSIFGSDDTVGHERD